MKRVLFISNIPARYRQDLFNKLSKSHKGHFEFLFVSEKTVKHKDILWSGKENDFFNRSTIINDSGIFSNYFQLFRYLWKNKYDSIVVGAIPYYFPILIMYKVFNGTKIYVWWAGTINTEKKGFGRKWYRKFVSFFITGAFFYSNYSKNYFLDKIKKRINRTFVLGNNTRFSDIELNKINNLRRIEINETSNQLHLINIGFQDKRKNTIQFLKAIKKLQNEQMSFITTIIGDGPQKEKLVSFAKENQLKQVHFIGNISNSEIYSYLVKSDILVHSSISDSWPQVFNEGSFCSIAILVSNKSGIDNQYVNENREMVVFDPNNLEDLKTKLKNILLDHDLLGKLKESSFNYIRLQDGRTVSEIFINELT